MNNRPKLFNKKYVHNPLTVLFDVAHHFTFFIKNMPLFIERFLYWTAVFINK